MAPRACPPPVAPALATPGTFATPVRTSWLPARVPCRCPSRRTLWLWSLRQLNTLLPAHASRLRCRHRVRVRRRVRGGEHHGGNPPGVGCRHRGRQRGRRDLRCVTRVRPATASLRLVVRHAILGASATTGPPARAAGGVCVGVGGGRGSGTACSSAPGIANPTAHRTLPHIRSTLSPPPPPGANQIITDPALLIPWESGSRVKLPMVKVRRACVRMGMWYVVCGVWCCGTGRAAAACVVSALPHHSFALFPLSLCPAPPVYPLRPQRHGRCTSTALPRCRICTSTAGRRLCTAHRCVGVAECGDYFRRCAGHALRPRSLPLCEPAPHVIPWWQCVPPAQRIPFPPRAHGHVCLLARACARVLTRALQGSPWPTYVKGGYYSVGGNDTSNTTRVDQVKVRRGWPLFAVHVCARAAPPRPPPGGP